MSSDWKEQAAEPHVEADRPDRRAEPEAGHGSELAEQLLAQLCL